MSTISVDYNLLRPLRALLEERSVTRAAERLHVAQPTMSISLSRLRSHFGDPLLVRKGREHELTVLGQQLLSELPATMVGIDRVLQLQATFDAAASNRTFEIAGVDYAVARVAPALNRIVTVEAPTIHLEFIPAASQLVNELPDSLRSIDGLILPHGYIAGQDHLDLFIDNWVCVVDVESDIGEQATVEDLSRRRWVHTLAQREGMTPARRQLQSQGVDLFDAVVTPHFLVVSSLVAGTDRIALLPETLARQAEARGEGVRVVKPPTPLDPIRETFWWHRDRAHDAGHLWLRDVLKRAHEETIAKHNVHH